MEDYEKLGAFYLGRPYDLKEKKAKEGILLYDSKDLLTHAVCVGMTGSGKTGLCIALLEEAAIDGETSVETSTDEPSDAPGETSNEILQVLPAQFTISSMPMRMLAEGDGVDLWNAPQGGHVVLFGAKVKNMTSDTANLKVRFRRPSTGLIVAEEGRTVKMVPAPGEPGVLQPDIRSNSQVANVPLCPSLPPDGIVDESFDVEVLVTALYTQPVQTGTAKIRVVARCSTPSDEVFCRCECGPNYFLGKCSEFPDGGDGCQLDGHARAGAGVANDEGMDRVDARAARELHGHEEEFVRHVGVEERRGVRRHLVAVVGEPRDDFRRRPAGEHGDLERADRFLEDDGYTGVSGAVRRRSREAAARYAGASRGALAAAVPAKIVLRRRPERRNGGLQEAAEERLGADFHVGKRLHGEDPRELGRLAFVLNLDVSLDHAGLHHEDDVFARLIDGHRPRARIAKRAAAGFGRARRRYTGQKKSRENHPKLGS